MLCLLWTTPCTGVLTSSNIAFTLRQWRTAHAQSTVWRTTHGSTWQAPPTKILGNNTSDVMTRVCQVAVNSFLLDDLWPATFVCEPWRYPCFAKDFNNVRYTDVYLCHDSWNKIVTLCVIFCNFIRLLGERAKRVTKRATEISYDLWKTETMFVSAWVRGHLDWC